jgi:hypothetical protein
MQASCAHAASLACAFALLAGCNLTQEGQAPGPGTLNYPIALALSEQRVERPDGTLAPEYLFVVNSNFDLRFNTGSLQALDLEAVALAIDEECGGGRADCVITLPDAAQGIVATEVGIGSHTDGISVGPGGRRIYLPVRSERNLVFVDFVETPEGVRFECDAERDEDDVIPRCGEGAVAGVDPVASERGLELDGDPVAVASGRLEDISDGVSGNFVLLALRDGRVALFIDDLENEPPRLVHIASGFPENLVTMTLQPGTGIAWLTSAQTGQLGRVGIAIDESNPDRSFLFDAGSVSLGGIDDGEDLRDLQFAPSDPSRAFVLSRRPPSVLTLQLDERGLADVEVDEIFEAGAGPSRLAPVEIGGRTFVLASSFDAQKLFAFDAEVGLVSVLGGFSGPFELVYDAARQWVYLTDFTTSQIRIIDVEPLVRPQPEPPALLATLGEVVAAGSILD